jgi:hypothetical protein
MLFQQYFQNNGHHLHDRQNFQFIRCQNVLISRMADRVIDLDQASSLFAEAETLLTQLESRVTVKSVQKAQLSEMRLFSDAENSECRLLLFK